MATRAEQWDQAFALLDKFERQLIEPSAYRWAYITAQTGVSKPTLWRNQEFEREYQRVKILVKAYALGEKQFDQVQSIKAAREREKDQQIEDLKAAVIALNEQLSRERERLVYAALIARRRNIDPEDFLERCPLNRRVGNDIKSVSMTQPKKN
jgi:multidrug efflux pump subunit AcrA (membrane-fusion protein)